MSRNSSALPSPKSEYLIRTDGFFGGLDLSQPDHRLPPDESPEMKNMVVDRGILSCRDGQAWLTNPFTPSLGTGHTCYERVWKEHIICHIGGSLYAFPAYPGGSYAAPLLICLNVPDVRGTFFAYDGGLYYKTTGAYLKITASYNSGTQTWSFSASAVTGYVPTILTNAEPSSGSGTLYQPENRLSPDKTVWYTPEEGVTQYHLPVKATSVVSVTVGGTPTSAYTYSSITGIVTFSSAPPHGSENSVHITYRLPNPDAMASVMDCRFAAVYGGTTGELCTVMAGSAAQPNAYFWNGNTSLAMDPSYFPMENYQLAGDAEEKITGFAKQQSYLVIFKEHSLGRTSQGTEEIGGRMFIDMAFIPINAKIGCDLPWTVQLVENNLVWADSVSGIHLLRDTSSAFENNVMHLSGKIDPDGAFPGLRSNLSSVTDPDAVCAFDDGSRYLLTDSRGHTWLWDYRISAWKAPSWFYFTNQQAVVYVTGGENVFSMNAAGRLTAIRKGTFSDYNAPILKLFRSASQSFGNVRAVKNINSLDLVCCPKTACTSKLTYITDHETRRDLTDLVCAAPSGEYEKPSVFHRRPMCRHVLYFAILLENNNTDEDMAVSSAEIYFNEQGRTR